MTYFRGGRGYLPRLRRVPGVALRNAEDEFHLEDGEVTERDSPG
jgi:hypothetical protein